MTVAVATDFPEVNVRELWSPVARYCARKYIKAAQGVIRAYDLRKSVAPVNGVDFTELKEWLGALDGKEWDCSKAVSDLNKHARLLGGDRSAENVERYQAAVLAAFQYQSEVWGKIGEARKKLPPTTFEHICLLNARNFKFHQTFDELLKVAKWVPSDRRWVGSEVKKIAEYVFGRCPDLDGEMKVSSIQNDMFVAKISAGVGQALAKIKYDCPTLELG